ncbi:MAG: hypothetical protein ACREBT_04840, partial [Thermoplasmata archaeon]
MVVVIVVVAASVGTLFALGVLKLPGSGGGGGPSSPTYPVAFQQTGLASGAAWSVNLNGTSQSSTSAGLNFSVKNGSYPYVISAVGYLAVPSSGSLTILGRGANVSVLFTAAATYAVTFTESGLPGGTSWSVTFGGVAESSTTASIAFVSASGAFSYTVGAVSGFAASPSSGILTVSGTTNQSITFTSTSSSALTYAQALPLANSVAQGQSSSAQLVIGAGGSSTVTYEEDATDLNFTGCTWSGATSFTVPANPSGYYSGATPLWLFEYYVSSPAELLTVAVTSGTASVLGGFTGSCLADFEYAAVPSAPIDSSAATAAVQSDAAAFISDYPSANASLTLSPSVTFTFENYTYYSAGDWEVTYATCPLSGTGSGVGTQYNATVNATTGAVMYNGGVQSISCSDSSVAQGAALSAGSAGL